MSAIEHSSAFDSSATSSHISTTNESDTLFIKNHIKTLLKSRIFLGRFIERRLTDQRVGYRDVVLVSAAEVELKKDLTEAKRKLKSVFPRSHWIGITDTDVLKLDTSGICIWTEIDNQPFGPFWFQIRSVKFREAEVIILLKCIRHISEAFLEIEPVLMGSNKHPADNKISKTNIGADSVNETYNEIVGNLKSALTISNIKELVTFFFAFVIAIFTGSSAFVNFLGNFILALLREMSIFVKNSTPMFLGFLDFISKIIGGFYILVAMFFKPNRPPINKRAVPYSPHHYTNQYDSRNFD